MTETCDFEAMSRTTEAHERLKAFEGTFRAVVKMWMDPTQPPMESTGTMTNTMELGGRFLVHDYKGDPNDGPFPEFEGRGYWGFNTITNKYEGVWIDNASTIMQTEAGDVDETGTVWTMAGAMPTPDGGSTPKKSVVTLTDNDHHSMEMFWLGPDGSEFKGMEIQYTRA